MASFLFKALKNKVGIFNFVDTLTGVMEMHQEVNSESVRQGRF